MILQKREYSLKEYRKFFVPDLWKVKLINNDLDEEIRCTQCGKTQKAGECMTSKTIHNQVGFGYPVCVSCYEKEVLDEKEHKG